VQNPVNSAIEKRSKLTISVEAVPPFVYFVLKTSLYLVFTKTNASNHNICHRLCYNRRRNHTCIVLYDNTIVYFTCLTCACLLNTQWVASTIPCASLINPWVQLSLLSFTRQPCHERSTQSPLRCSVLTLIAVSRWTWNGLSCLIPFCCLHERAECTREVMKTS